MSEYRAGQRVRVDYTPPARWVQMAAGAIGLAKGWEGLVEREARSALTPVLADLRAQVCGLPVLARRVDHPADCPGRPGQRGICTCDRQMVEMVSVDAVLAIIDGGGSNGA